ncbi:MAG TPA: nucleoside diphosphate kinase regulator [Rhodanobacteraceae bacterium]|nr:nucleoside diphosphate kinase regulator [Rhodanobacteraceae bacterium]
MSDKPAITLSSRDFDRLDALLRGVADEDAHAALRDELERARVVEPAQLPAGVVSMNSIVRLADVDNGEEMTLTLVYPREAGKPGTVSIFAPVGSALLGLSVDQQIDWPLPGNRSRRLRVLAVEYQPEAAGDFHL